MSVIRTVPPETVRAFYKRHYHPERMAVVAVGDFEDGGKGVVSERRAGDDGGGRTSSSHVFLGVRESHDNELSAR